RVVPDEDPQGRVQAVRLLPHQLDRAGAEGDADRLRATHARGVRDQQAHRADRVAPRRQAERLRDGAGHAPRVAARRAAPSRRPAGLVFDMRFNRGADSYRAYRFPWVGRPTDRPALAVDRAKSEVSVYASWNGATQVRRWALLAGSDSAHLRRIVVAPRNGFET